MGLLKNESMILQKMRSGSHPETHH